MIPIPAEIYSWVYLIIVLLISIPAFMRYGGEGASYRNNGNDSTRAFFLTFLMILFIGLRPNSPIFADGPGYYKAMIDHRWEGAPLGLSDNFLFVAIMSFMSSVGTHPQLAFVVLALINFGFTYIAVRKLFPSDQMVAMLVFFGAFSTFSYATNGIKAGCAAPFFLCALAYRDKPVAWIPFLVAAMGFHHSMEVSIASFIICKFIKNPKFYMVLWILCFLMAAFHITFFQVLFSGFTDDHGAGYLLSEDTDFFGEQMRGFRIDFILYGMVPIVIGWIAYYKKQIKSNGYIFLLNVYTLINGIWLLCMYAAYTNRIAYLSWQLLPVVLIYPLLREDWGDKKLYTFRIVAFCHLAFTLFMSFIYY